MTRFEQIRDRLHSLYRPDDDDKGLLTLFLQAVAEVLDEVQRETSHVLQAHWYKHADKALYSPYFIQSRKLQNLPPPALKDSELTKYPYLYDLAHLGSLLSIPPRQEPPALRELVEAYRLRIDRIVKLYCDGLGTVNALRRMVEAQLHVKNGEPAEQRDRPFLVEEFMPPVSHSLSVPTRGEPDGVVGPLMRWTVTNDSLEASALTLYIQGMMPQENLIDATKDPMVELFQADGSDLRLGIAYKGTIDQGNTLRLRPAYASWIGLDNGIQKAEASPTEDTPADPTAPGAWQSVAEAPTNKVAAICQTCDRVLWVAANTDANGELWRYDGCDWTSALTGLPILHCLAEDDQDLLIGTEKGLLRMPLYPKDGDPFATTPAPANLDGSAVYAILQAVNSTWWAGTKDGAAQLVANDALNAMELQGTAVYAISQDEIGALYFGTDLGLFQYQPNADRWYWYSGMEHTEQKPDWKPFSSGTLPTTDQVGLPSVKSVYRGQDTSLWIGTDNGIARYVARSVRGLTYETILEAFPDLTTGSVVDIKEDERGEVWFCTDSGLLRYDGRDWWQFQAGAWAQLGRADMLYNDTPGQSGTWRFQRASSQWQYLGYRASGWNSFSGDPRTTDEASVHTVCWTDQVVADIGTWDGTDFTNPTAVDMEDLNMRYKPDKYRIIDGGIPAVPRLPGNSSVWRYLSREPDVLVAPDEQPPWTIEGRLLPPPSDLEPGPGRYNTALPLPSSNFDEAVFAFRPTARVWFEWRAKRPLTILIRLKKQTKDENIDPAILDRVWQGIQQVRPAGVHTALAVEEEIVRGDEDNG